MQTHISNRTPEFINGTVRFAKDEILEHIPLVKWIYEEDQPSDRWFKDGRDYIGTDENIHPIAELSVPDAERQWTPKYPHRIK